MYIGYIYKITNKVNDKSYIGKTNNIIRRWKEHKYGHGGTSILSKAFIKYGIENFEFSIIDMQKCSTIKELNKQLSELEVYYIGIYDTFRNGYNATIGGEGISFYKHSEETKKRISNSNKGKVLSKERLEKMRAAMLGRHHTPEAKEKIRKALLNRNHAIYEKMALKNKGKHRDHEMIMKGAMKRKKPILQYDKYGNFLKEYKGATDTGYNTIANIIACCKGKIKSAYGYIWRYKLENNYPLHITIPNNARAQFYKTVSQYSKEGKFIAMYDSISRASLSTGIKRNSICNCLYGRSKTAGNYVWRFKEEEINI